MSSATPITSRPENWTRCSAGSGAPGAETPTLDGPRDWLDGLGMSEWCQPSRLELLPQLPRNENGKVRKNPLRERLRPRSAD